MTFIFSGIMTPMMPLSLTGTEMPFVLSLYVKKEFVSILASFELTKRQVSV